MSRAKSVLVAVALVASLASSPTGLAAEGGAGAKLLITKPDGSHVYGELVAVRPDALFLMDLAGRDIRVGLEEIRGLRIVRKSPVAFLAVFGAMAGSGLMGSAYGAGHELSGVGGVYGGLLGALCGLTTAVLAGADRKLAPDEVALFRLDDLRRVSREGRARSASKWRGRLRFRLGLSSTMSFREETWESRASSALWSFRGEVPPAEAGPHAISLYQSWKKGIAWASYGPVSLAFDWTDHWSSEIEIFVPGANQGETVSADAHYVSSTDGETYHAIFWCDRFVRFKSVLFGLVLRPVTASSGRRTSFEIGAAAGPSWVTLKTYDGLLPMERRTVLSARALAAIDHYLSPHVALGIFCSYRRTEATFPDAVAEPDLEFRNVDDIDYETAPIIRPIQITVPARTFSLSGVRYGIRIEFRI